MCRWVKIHDSIFNQEWSQDPFTVSLVVHLILLANYKETTQLDTVVQRGQLITTVAELSVKTGMTTKQVRNRIERLVKDNFITIRTFKTAKKASIITIINYERYQGNTSASETSCDTVVNKPKESKPKETKTAQKRRTFTESNMQQRLDDFKESIRPYVEKYGRDMCNEFYSYWTQPLTTNQFKMAFEDQDKWSIAHRLAYWNKVEKEKGHGTNRLLSRSEQRDLETQKRREQIAAEIAYNQLHGEPYEEYCDLPGGL